MQYILLINEKHLHGNIFFFFFLLILINFTRVNFGNISKILTKISFVR